MAKESKEKKSTSKLEDLKDDEIIALISDRERQGNIPDRNALITELENIVYRGQFTDELEKLLGTEVRRSKREKLLINLCQARVVDKANQTRGLPDLKVRVAAQDPDDRHILKRITTNAIYDKWEFCNLPMMLPQIAFRLSYAGYQPVVALPDFTKKKVLFSLRDPKSIIADFSGQSSIEFNWVAFSYKLTGRQLINTFPGASKIMQINYTDDEYEVKEWLSPSRRLFFVEAGIGEDAYRGRIPDTGVQHNLGFIPVRVVQNIPTPNRLESISDIAHVVGLNENINELALLYTKEARTKINPLLVMKGAEDLPQDLPDGEGKYIVAGPEGEISYVPKISGDPTEVFSHMGQQMQTFREQTAWPLSMSGTINSSIWTGKGINASQQGSRELAMGVKENIGTELVRLDEMALAIEKKMFPKVKQEVYDYYGGPEGEEEFVYYYPEDLPDPEQYRHELVFYPQGYDASVEAVNLIQLGSTGYLSKEKVRERLPNVNPDEEKKRIRQEQEEELEFQQKMMAATQPQQPQEIPEGAETGTPYESPLPDIPEHMTQEHITQDMGGI